MEERITSRRNPLLAHTKKLLTSRSYREKTGEFAADGVKLLAEAARILADKAYLESVYKAGAEKASYTAAKTLRKVYKKVGFVAR